MNDEIREYYGTVNGKVYPRIGTKRSTAELKTVPIELTRDQAIAFARNVLDAAIAAETVTITGWRKRDQVTVTTPPGAGGKSEE